MSKWSEHEQVESCAATDRRVRYGVVSDLNERAVLGDELQQRGDPLGELINLQLALDQLPATAPEARRRLIERKIATHLDAHHDAFYGPLAAHVTRSSQPDLFDPALWVKSWRAGFADAITVMAMRSGPTLVDVLRTLRALPIARFVRLLGLGCGNEPTAALAELVREPMATLRELELFHTTQSQPPYPPIEIVALEPLLCQLELLRVLRPVTYRRFVSPTLRTLTLWIPSSGSTGPTIRFDPGIAAIEDLTVSGFLFDRELFARYPRLRRMSLSGWYEPGWIEQLLHAPQLPAFERLTLGWRLTDADLEMVVRAGDRVAHLTLLDLSANGFSQAARVSARERLPPCVRL